MVELVLPNSFSLLSEDKSPKISAQPSATHDPMGKLSKDDVLKYAPIVISLLALTTTVVIAAYQTGISSSLRDLSVLTNHQALEAKDLSLMSGISVDITEGKVILNNLGTTAVTDAGYWAVHTAEDTYTDYMSQTTPIPGCSSMTFDLSTLPQQPASLKSVVLAFQVPSGDWWSVSDIGLLEKSPSSRTADWTEAAENLKSFKLQADTVMEGFGSHQTVTVDGVTGPIPNIEAYVTENGTSGISALITKSPCA